MNEIILLPGPDENSILLTLGENDSKFKLKIIRFLSQLPHVAESIKKLSPSDTFRVVMSRDNAKLFKKAPDGFYKPFLHDGSKFVENVDLEKISPDFLGAASNLLMSVNMAAIAADLNTIKMEVRDLGSLVSNSNRGEVHGAISAVRQVKALSDPSEQRRETLGACRDLSIHLGKLAGQLKSHIGAMPEPKAGFFDTFLRTRL